MTAQAASRAKNRGKKNAQAERSLNVKVMLGNAFERLKTKYKGSSRNDKIVALLLSAILVYAFSYSILFVQGPSYNGDDISYAWAAYYAHLGTFVQNTGNILSIRPLQIYPIAFFVDLLGINMYSLTAWSTCCFIATILIVFLIGKELYNSYAGLLAALLFAFLPTIVVISGQMSDNTPMTLFVSLTMLGLVYGQRRSSNIWYFVCGASLVAGFLTIPLASLAIIMVVLYLFIEVLRRRVRIDRHLSYLALGFGVAIIILILFNTFNSHNPLITFTENYNFFQTEYNQSYGLAYNPETSTLQFYIYTMFPYHIFDTFRSFFSPNFNLITAWNQIYPGYNNVGFYFYAAVIAIVYLLFKREKHAYFALFWFIIGFLLLEFDPAHISLSPFSYFLQHRLDRYLTLIAPAAVLLISMSLVTLATSGKKLYFKYAKTAFAVIVVVFLISTAIPLNLKWYDLTLYERQTQIELANYVNTLPNSTRIYINSGMLVAIYMHFDNVSRIEVYDQIENCTSISPNSYIAIPIYSDPYDLPYVPDPQKYCPSWQLVLSPPPAKTNNQFILGLGAVDQVALYYVPQ